MLIYSCFSCSCLFLFELLNLCGVISTTELSPLTGLLRVYTARLHRLGGVTGLLPLTGLLREDVYPKTHQRTNGILRKTS